MTKMFDPNLHYPRLRGLNGLWIIRLTEVADRRKRQLARRRIGGEEQNMGDKKMQQEV